MPTFQEKTGFYSELIEACSFILNNDQIAAQTKAYLDARIPKELQSTFNFGYFPKDDELKYLYSFINKQSLEKFGFIYPKINNLVSFSHGHFSDHNLILPFKDMYGNVISILGRTILSEQEREEKELQKYKYTFGSNKEFYLFGLNLAKDNIIKKDYAICVEGQFDCISAHINGITNTIAVGSASLSRYHLFQLRRYTNNIVLMFDNDEAGKLGKDKAKKKYSNYANIVSISIPDGYKDIDELLKRADDTQKQHIIAKLSMPFTDWKKGLNG